MDRFIGIRAEGLEQARELLEKETKIKGVFKDHDDMGGEYYEFELPDGKSFVLLRNLDLKEAVPFTHPKHRKWEFIVQFAEMGFLDEWIELLKRNPTKFKELHD
ncbi:MAG: hypothetical protein CTY20_08355 [Hyphomicrobium sp.]|nr:MAG: hypothetical protein CTY20_08355 [Hyphomicrobium sp.]